MFEVTVEETFAAAHQLREYQGKCEKLHGHNYRVRMTVCAGELDRVGLVVDFVELKRELRGVMERLDHAFLNEIPPFDAINPSAENLAKYIYDQMPPALKSGPARISAVKIWETGTSTATYRP
ncbi:MAG: 6-carboxytetrahydropterin synthase QueD [Acidobacteria bacterium]|nr:6-carboxytetrahydropterin synthase QueD [Acidobacteriota bacterium]